MKRKIVAAALVLAAVLAGCSAKSPATEQLEEEFAIKGAEILHYEDNRVVPAGAQDAAKDIKTVFVSGEKACLVNALKGYMMDFPADTTFDFARSPVFDQAENALYTVRISREWSPYADVDGYIDYYLNRFIDSEEYCAANRITYLGKEKRDYHGYETELISIRIDELNAIGDTAYADGYTYVTVQTDSRYFYRFLYKYQSADYDAVMRSIDMGMQSFASFAGTGEGHFDFPCHPVLPASWSKETRDVYEQIKNASGVRWGVFVKDIYGEGIDQTVPQLEQKLDYHFPVILSYLHFGMEFPTEFMQKCYDDGKLVELTYQITESNNENLFGATPNLAIYRGERDDTIRAFARAAKAFGHPFLFRLNNEMNSDWTSYSGVVNLSDPEIYVENWRRIYRIFEEEGVDNAIWIFNPNDNNYPPCDWNDFMAYYPGNGYVHLIGVTGYNTGSYYRFVTGEAWRDFQTIYDGIAQKYNPHFASFPWIITEFASSSVGGNKVHWIDEMFDRLGDYPNIKIAVWFSYADYDYRVEGNTVVARPYWLDETESTTEAFRRGLAAHGVQTW